jgi:hypothetical protein
LGAGDRGLLTAAGRGVPGSPITVTMDGRSLGTTPVNGNGRWLFEQSAVLAPGEHRLRIDGARSAPGPTYKFAPDPAWPSGAEVMVLPFSPAGPVEAHASTGNAVPVPVAAKEPSAVQSKVAAVSDVPSPVVANRPQAAPLPQAADVPVARQGVVDRVRVAAASVEPSGDLHSSSLPAPGPAKSSDAIPLPRLVLEKPSLKAGKVPQLSAATRKRRGAPLAARVGHSKRYVTVRVLRGKQMIIISVPGGTVRSFKGSGLNPRVRAHVKRHLPPAT